MHGSYRRGKYLSDGALQDPSSPPDIYSVKPSPAPDPEAYLVKGGPSSDGMKSIGKEKTIDEAKPMDPEQLENLKLNFKKLGEKAAAGKGCVHVGGSVHLASWLWTPCVLGSSSWI
jgi:hypothetical protein